jgi:hypothetical protein
VGGHQEEVQHHAERVPAGLGGDSVAGGARLPGGAAPQAPPPARTTPCETERETELRSKPRQLDQTRWTSVRHPEDPQACQETPRQDSAVLQGALLQPIFTSLYRLYNFDVRTKLHISFKSYLNLNFQYKTVVKVYFGNWGKMQQKMLTTNYQIFKPVNYFQIYFCCFDFWYLSNLLFLKIF